MVSRGRFKGLSLKLLLPLALLCLLAAPRMVSLILSNIGMVSLGHSLATPGLAKSARTLAQAEVWFERAVAATDRNASAHRGLARILFLRGDDSQSLLHWQMGGMEAQHLILWGEQAFREGQHELALRWYQQAALVDPAGASDALYLQHQTLMESGEEGLAWTRLHEAVALDRGWPSGETRFLVWQRWGLHLREIGDMEQAEDALSKAIAVFPEEPDKDLSLALAYRLLGEIQLDLGMLQAAAQNLRASLQLDAESAWVHLALGKAMYLSGAESPDQAQQVFATALQLGASDAAIWNQLIEFWRANGELERARSLCEDGEQVGLSDLLRDACTWP